MLKYAKLLSINSSQSMYDQLLYMFRYTMGHEIYSVYPGKYLCFFKM